MSVVIFLNFKCAVSGFQLTWLVVTFRCVKSYIILICSLINLRLVPSYFGERSSINRRPSLSSAFFLSASWNLSTTLLRQTYSSIICIFLYAYNSLHKVFSSPSIYPFPYHLS